MNKLRMIIHIAPWGFSKGQKMDVDFKHKKLNDLHYSTRGEGQALQFVLEDYDASTGFHRALEDGRFVKDFGGGEIGHFELRFVPEGKSIELIDYDAEIEQKEIIDGIKDLDSIVAKMGKE